MSTATGRRRKPSRGDITEAAILDTAEKLLGERPLSGITVDELARGAGISRPSFYFHFESREAVLRALAERIVDELSDASDRWLERGGDPPAAAVRRTIEGILALWHAHGPVLRAMIEAGAGDAELRRFWTGVGKRFVDATAAQIERERAAGVAPEGPDAAGLAAVLVAMNDRVFYDHSRHRRSAAEDRRLVDTLTAVWLRAVYGSDSP